MNALRPISYYDAHAQSVDLTEITSSDNNAEILEQLRDDELTSLWICQHANNWVDAFFVQEGDDLGWLGYFIGRSTVLDALYITDAPEDEDRERIAALVIGIEQSKSIRELGICGDHNVLSSLSAMLQSESCCLTLLELNDIPFGDDAAAALADALKGCKSLTGLSLCDSDLSGYREQIPILISGIGQSRSIQKLSIEGNDLGESVLSSLSAVLQYESCPLTSLKLQSYRNPLRDGVAVALADALKGNKSLTELLFNPDDLTSVGWSAFSRLLSDSSSVSNIYASNHTLQTIGYESYNRINYPQARDVEQLLALNGLTDKHAAIQKILMHHPDLDVGPFLRDEWELKLLPLVMSWFVRVRGISEELRNAPRLGPYGYDTGRAERIRKTSVESEEEIEKRQLLTMYNFVRGMPLVAIDGYHSYSVGPKVGRHTYRRYSGRKKEKFDLLVHNFTGICTLLLLRLLDLLCVCLLGLCVCLLVKQYSLPTWGDFIASSLCVCLLKLYY
jgi:hypothetical protein